MLEDKNSMFRPSLFLSSKLSNFICRKENYFLFKYKAWIIKQFYFNLNAVYDEIPHSH